MNELVNISEDRSFYGKQQETLDSLILTFLPSLGHVYKRIKEESLAIEPTDTHLYFLQIILIALREAGFYIPKVALLTIQFTLIYMFLIFSMTPM